MRIPRPFFSTSGTPTSRANAVTAAETDASEGEDVGAFDLALGEEAGGLAQAGTFDGVAHAAGVGEPRLGPLPGQLLAEHASRTGSEGVTGVGGHQAADLVQLVDGVAGEADVVRDTGCHPGVGPEEGRVPTEFRHGATSSLTKKA